MAHFYLPQSSVDALRKLLRQRGIRGDVGRQGRLPADNDVGNHAAKNSGTVVVEVGAVAVGEVVRVGVGLTDGLDVLPGNRVEVEQGDADGCSRLLGCRGHVGQAVDQRAVGEGAARERRQDDGRCAGRLDLVGEAFEVGRELRYTDVGGGFLSRGTKWNVSKSTQHKRLRVRTWSLWPNWMVT